MWLGASDKKDELSRTTLIVSLSTFALFCFLWVAKQAGKTVPPLPPATKSEGFIILSSSLSVLDSQNSYVSNTVSAMWLGWLGASSEKDELPRTTLIVSLFTFALFCFLWVAKQTRKTVPPLPPGPRGLPLVGYLPFLGTEPHKKFEELAGIYGPIYKVWLGKKLCVVVNSPSLVKEVVRDQDTTFANRDPPVAALAATYGGADIAFLPYGHEWKKLRKIFVREMLSNASLDGSYTLRREQLRKGIRNVYEKIGTPIDVGELTFATLINVMMSLLWGGTLQEDEGANIAAEFKALLAELMVLFAKPNVSDFFPALARFDLQGIERDAKSIFEWNERIFDSAIDMRLKYLAKAKDEGPGITEQKEDFLQILLELRERDDAATSITTTQIKALLLDVLVGGSDTTTTMVEWAMAELMHHPEAMRRVHGELTEMVGLDCIVEESHLPKLNYLGAVIKETFRLHPALPLLVPRSPSQSSTIGGYTVPKGARIMLNVWAIHRDPKIWDNPLEFRPERFLNDSGRLDYSGNDFNYLPFGSGRRICAGLPLAEKTLKYVLASLLHQFEWQLPPSTELDLSDRFGIVTKKRMPLIAIPTPRLSEPELYTK
ncbi:Geraniol 8-hydroxylase [Morella rubra]|uniref:Geraniol 8-hydroxylase n=1 Tax=Morella rubra TaxID=262757 RepID=A0A6A1VZT6_9ROSI|nr:Geraniol 8-hydroxylase [Morella rubra]